MLCGVGCSHKSGCALLFTILLRALSMGYASRTRPEDSATDTDVANRSANPASGDLGPLPIQRTLHPVTDETPVNWESLKAPSVVAKHSKQVIDRFIAEHCGSVSDFLGNATACREYDTESADRDVLEKDLAALWGVETQFQREEEIEKKFDSKEGEAVGLLAVLDRPQVYFDFARPLSLTLRKAETDNAVIYFHYTQEEYAQLDDTLKKNVFAIKPLSRIALITALSTDFTGFDIATSKNKGGGDCKWLGTQFGRTDIAAPHLSSSVFEDCSARWGDGDSHFERCLMVRGCAARDKLDGHGGVLRPFKIQSYLGGLKADNDVPVSLPMCCGRSLRAAFRIWYFTHVAYETLGIKPPSNMHEEIKGLPMDQEHNDKLLDHRMHSYAQAQHMLTSSCAEDTQEALVASGLIGNMKNVITAVKDAVAHLLSSIEKLAHDMLYGSSPSLEDNLANPIADSWLGTAKDLMSRAFKAGKKVVIGTLKTLASVAKWLLEKGYSLTKWVLGHPQAAVLLSSIVVEVRTRLCAYFSETWFVEMGHGGAEVLDVGPAEYLFRKGAGLFKEVMPTKAQVMVILTQFLQTSSFWGKAAAMMTNIFSGVFSVFGIPFSVLAPFMEILGAVALDSLKNAAKLELFRLIDDTGSKLFFEPCLVRPKVMNVINPLAGLLQRSHEFSEEDVGQMLLA
mmetsp:Transcript_139286/g.277740  ORF Transcript_139286/g.277740 Transcript_139286/m.277740 type:complete len:681 (+) Transcript_139286:55-2097(+)|eukprot:CAMPEP_0172723930 /NCGR_PEP_ID=MMETSP1074-20121228/84822_1 /TAXON_ID=2916 /ORGANISM="Ceratium fusus, Strain PA161109" /LENGTH=680 /DNA_ID=CAMNT_0013550273 /DNA_START=47 /DNA_END=2089 /DNA_ORIENTATION=+